MPIFYLVTACCLLKDLQRKAARIVASKCALAARVDSFHESPLGEAGKGQLNCLSVSGYMLCYTQYNQCTVHTFVLLFIHTIYMFGWQILTKHIL